MDLAKDPGCDGAWGKGVRLVVDDCRNRFWLLARAVEDNGSTLKSLGIGLASESLLIDFARRREGANIMEWILLRILAAH